jgi:hypothetical protein
LVRALLGVSDADMSDEPSTREPAALESSGAASATPLDEAARAARDAEVARLRARRVPWDEVAARVGLSVRQAQRARLNHIRRAATYAALPEDPNRVLLEAVQHHRAALTDLARIAEDGDNSNAQMAAARARAQVARDLFKLLGDAGLTPQTAQAWRFTRQAPAFTQAVVDVAREAGLDLHAVLDRFEEVEGYATAMGYDREAA